jgi:hypothetical protein
MPREVREAPPPKRERVKRQTVFGRPWPLPISPVATGLLLGFLVVAAAAWYFEGRYPTPPAEAAKLLTPYKADDLRSVTLTTPEGSVTFERSADGKFVAPGPTPTPTPTPGPEATPAPVTLSPSTRLEGLINQLRDLRIDRVVASEPSTSPEYGLDQPRFTLTLVPRSGAPSTIAVGRLAPNETAYYVRREDRRDTVLVSRYTLDDLMKVAGDLIKEARPSQ